MKKSLPNFKGSVKGWSIVLAVIFCNSVFAQVPTTKQVAGLKTTQKPVKAKTRVNSKNNIIKNAIYLDKQRSNKKTLVPTPYSTRGFLPTQSIKRSSTSIKSTSKTIFHAINSRKLNTRSASAFPIEIFSEDFSSADSIPAGWSNVDMNDTGLVWQWNSGMSNGEFPATLDPVTSSSADGYVMFDSDGQGMSYGGELSFLTTPVINCSTNTFVYGELNHYFKRHINNKGYLLVSTDSTNWDTIFTAHAGLGINRGTDNADNTGGDISGFAANEPKVWFRFMWEGDYDYYWFIDDFRIYEPEIKDVSITDMSDHDPLYCDQYADSIRVEITNLGNDTVFGLTIGFSKNFGVANTYTISDTIPPDSTIYYVIPKTINFNSDKTTDFSVFTMLAGDDFTNNDSIFFDAKATNGSHVVTDGTFNLGFEVIEEDYKWGVEDANGDGWGWGQVTGNPNFASAGDGYMLYFNDNTSPFYTGVADDWFYTQCLFLDTGVTYKLTFDYYPFSDEGFDIMLGRAADPDSMTIVINNWNVTTANGYDTYENANITVAQPGDYHLGFHIITGINSYAVIIDEIEVDTVPKIDIGVISIDAPALNCSYGSGDTVKVTIQNFGTDAVSNFTVTYKAPGVEESESISTTLNPGATMQHTFKALIDLSSITDSTLLKAYTIEDKDLIKGNDTSNMWIYPISAWVIDQKRSFGFENSEDFTGWNFDDANVDGWGFDGLGFPFVNTAFANTDTNSAIYFNNDNGAADDWLFSTCLELDSAQKYELHHFYNSYNNPGGGTGGGGSGNDMYEVALMSSQDPQDTVFTIWDFGLMTSTFVYRDTILKFIAPNSGTYYIGFHVYTPAPSYAFIIDDISIRPAPDYELELIEMASPVTTCGQPDSVLVDITMVNNGEMYVTDFDVTYEYDFDTLNTVTITETITDTIWPGDTLNYVFGAILDFSAIGDYDFWTYFNIAGDVDNSNDSINVFISSLIGHDPNNGPLTQGFEILDTTANGDDFTGWTIEDANGDNNTWQIIIGNGFENSGDLVIYYNWNGDGATPGDDWLFTKCLALDTGKIYDLSFYYRAREAGGTTYPENLKVMIGMGPSAADMTDTTSYNDSLVVLPAIMNLTHALSTVQFSVPYPDNYYIGFHCFSKADQYSLFVDDIEIKEASNKDASIVDVYTTLTQCGLADSNEVTIEIFNNGLDKLVNFNVHYDLNGTVVTETVDSTIAPGDTLVYIFNTLADYSTSNSDYELFTVTAYTGLTGDEENRNDTMATALYSVVSHDFANSGPIASSFEAGEDLIGFAIEDANQDGVVWGLTGWYSNTGSTALNYFHDLGNGIDADDWFFVKCGDLDTNQIYEISFFHRVGLFNNGNFFDQAGFTERLRIAAVIDTQSFVGRSIDVLTIDEITNTDYEFVWDTFMVDRPGTYYIGFQLQNDPNYPYVDDGSLPIYSIDDIEIRQVDAKDVGVIDVQEITADCELSSGETVTATIRNYGIADASNFEIQYTVNGGTAVKETVSSNVKYNETIDYTFTTNVDLSAKGSYTIEVKTNQTGDAFAGNDDYSAGATSVSPHAPTPASEGGDGAMSFGFDSTDDLDGWLYSEDANNDGVEWQVWDGAGGGFNSSGDSSIYILKNDNGFTSMDDWFFSKCMDLKAGNKYLLSFRYQTLGWDPGAGQLIASETQRLKVMLGQGQNSASMTDDVIDLGTFDSDQVFTDASTDTFSVSSDGTYYFGFNCYSGFQLNTSTQQYLIVDEIDISTNVGVDDINIESNISLYPNPSENNFTLELNFPVMQDNVEIAVYDLLGSSIYKIHKENVTQEKVVLDMSGKANGVYFLNIKTPFETMTQKMIIAR